MPFTPTHIIAVLPLWPARRWLPFPALAIGTMIPDFGLFFPVVDYATTHSPLGVFTTCLPLGVAGFLFFESVMRLPLVRLLPIWFQRRIEIIPQLPMSSRLGTQALFYFGVMVAVIIGAFSHQIWDAFTHQGRWGTVWVPALNSEVPIGGYSIPGYKIFQYGSTFAGLPLLAGFALITLCRVNPKNDWNESDASKSDASNSDASESEALGSDASTKALLAMLTLFAIPLLVGVYAMTTQTSAYQAVFVTVTLSGAIILVVCILYCIVFRIVTSGEN